MISAAQLRAARGLLDWTRADLAKAANISPETVKNIEHGTFRPQENTAEAIVKAFEGYHVHFTENQGVQLKHDAMVRLEGVEGFKKFMEDVYKAAQDPASSAEGDKPICLSNVDDRLFLKYLGEDFFNNHIRRMNQVKNLKMRILIMGKPYTQLPEEKNAAGGGYREYRTLPHPNVGNVPFYVYGDKLAILMFSEEPAPQIAVISSAVVARAYREQFEIIWQTAKSIEG